MILFILGITLRNRFHLQVLRDRRAVALWHAGEQPQDNVGSVRHMDRVPVDLNATSFLVSSLHFSAGPARLHGRF